MPVKLKNWLSHFSFRPSGIFLISLVFSFVGVVFSPALQSAGLFLMFIALLWEWRARRRSFSSMTNPVTRMQLLLPVLLFILVLTDFVRGYPAQEVFDTVISRIAFVVIPLSLAVFHHQVREYVVETMLLGFGFLLSVVGLISVLRYFNHKAYYDALLIQSKHIPVAGGMNHIYYSLAAALVLTFIVFGIRQYRKSGARVRTIFAVLVGLVLLVCMHILSTRTGLLVLYSGIGAAFVISAYRGAIGKRITILAMTAMILLPVLAYLSFGSFRSKIQNSWEDLQAIREGGDEINHKSMGMRMESYRVGTLLLAEHWAIGTGKSGVKEAMQMAYEKANSVLSPENRIEPHNQFLHFGIAFGVTGLLVFSFFWILPFFDFRHIHPIFLSVLVILLITSMLEPLLERQSGMFLFFFFYFWFLERQGEKIEKGRKPYQHL